MLVTARVIQAAEISANSSSTRKKMAMAISACISIFPTVPPPPRICLLAAVNDHEKRNATFCDSSPLSQFVTVRKTGPGLLGIGSPN